MVKTNIMGLIIFFPSTLSWSTADLPKFMKKECNYPLFYMFNVGKESIKTLDILVGNIKKYLLSYNSLPDYCHYCY